MESVRPIPGVSGAPCAHIKARMPCVLQFMQLVLVWSSSCAHSINCCAFLSDWCLQIRLEKEALAKKLKAMEGKILKVCACWCLEASGVLV